MVHQRLADILADSATLELATQGSAPWIAAAFFAEEGAFVLDVMLEARGRTLANLRAQPAVAVMLQQGDPMAPFAQGEGHAEVIDGAEDQFRAHITAKTPASAPLMGLPGLIPVRIRIDRWQITDVPAGWLPARELHG